MFYYIILISLFINQLLSIGRPGCILYMLIVKLQLEFYKKLAQIESNDETARRSVDEWEKKFVNVRNMYDVARKG